MPAQIFLGRDQRKSLLVVVGFASEEVEPLRSFIPPMSEQLGVVGRQDERRTVHDGGKAVDLFHARAEEVAGVLGGDLKRRAAIINFLGTGAAGDAVILDAGEAAMFGRRHVGPDVVEVEVKAYVSIEIAIARIARIPFVFAPDLPGRVEVATEY